MNDKRLLQPTLVLAMLAALASLAASCADQPPVKCTAANNPGASRYTLVSSTGDCTGATPFANKGEVIGVYTYVPSVSDPNTYTLPNSVTLQSDEASKFAATAEAADMADTDPNHHLYGLGTFDQSFPDANDICTISAMSPAEVTTPEVPDLDDEGNPLVDAMGNPVMQPAAHFKYVWSNVRIIVNADSIGNQIFADLDYTRDGCNAKFKVSTITPLVSCGDADGKPDQSLCDAPTDPAVGAVPPGMTTCEDQGGNVVCLPNKTEL